MLDTANRASSANDSGDALSLRAAAVNIASLCGKIIDFLA